MSKNQNLSEKRREGRMKLIALLLYIAEQKQESLETSKQLFRRLMLPKK